MSATKVGVIPCLKVPHGAASAEGQGYTAEGVDASHNAGVGSSSLPPAIRQGVVAHWVTRLVAHLQETCATTGATTLYQNAKSCSQDKPGAEVSNRAAPSHNAFEGPPDPYLNPDLCFSAWKLFA